MAKKPLEIDMIAGSQLRDTQGEMLSVEGADISELEAGRGRLNDNHAKGFYNSLGRVTSAKKILSKDDCSTDRHSYFWDKIKAPFIYCRGVLYDDEEHPNAKAAAAILRNIHNSDSPLQLKASVEGGVVSRGIKDDRLLARTKIHSVALTFTPANNATLVEPFEMTKSDSYEEDMVLIKSVMHLASKSDVPSFRHITRRASATKVSDNFNKINQMAQELGLKSRIDNPGQDNIVKSSVQQKIVDSIEKTNSIIKAEKIKAKIQHVYQLAKALTAGYGGAGAPSNLSGGGVIQSEGLDDGRGKAKKNEENSNSFKYLLCPNCGHEQIYMNHQVKCRDCNKHLPMSVLATAMMGKKKK
jgi:ribosomal protein S27E